MAGGGLIYNTYHRHLISISSLLLVVPGIFVASLGALPVLWVDLQKDRILLRERARYLESAARVRLVCSRGHHAVVADQPALAHRTRHPCCEATEPGGDVGAPCRAFS